MHKPQEIFNRLFNPYAGKGVEQVRAGLKRDASILDLVLEHSRSFKNRLGKEDQGKVDEYLDSIRALEQRVERTSKWTHQPLPEVDTKGLNLEVSHKDPQEYIRCMYDLIYLAFQTDSTRFATLMLESEQSSDSEMWNYATYVLGYKGATHDIAHKRPADYSGQWDQWRAEQHAYFLQAPARHSGRRRQHARSHRRAVGLGPPARVPQHQELPDPTRRRQQARIQARQPARLSRATRRSRWPTCLSRCSTPSMCRPKSSPTAPAP